MIEDLQRENDRLRAENVQLKDDLAAVTRQCEILHSLTKGTAAYAVAAKAGRFTIQIGSRERMAMLEHTVDMLEGFVAERASWACYGCGNDHDCEPCQASTIIESIKSWRYGGSMEVPSRRFEGSMHYRTSDGWNPREAKIHGAWAKRMQLYGPDRTFGLILTDRQPGLGGMLSITDWPTPRDWYVATSIVQWLATAVGSSILEEAGWEYTQHDEDRRDHDTRLDELSRQKAAT